MDKSLARLVIPMGIAATASLLVLVLRSILLRYWAHLARRNPDGFASRILVPIKLPSIFLSLAIGLYIGIAASELTSQQARPLTLGTHIILILSLTLAIANIAASLFRRFMGSSGLALGMIRGGILLVGVLVILSVLGISVAPLLTALGVGGLAVALALKDTLENLFAGIYLISEGAIRSRDFLRLETGHEGIVQDIGWRTTKIKMTNNNMVLIPNSKLAQSVVINFSLPEKKLAVSLPINVDSSANFQKVEEILLDVTKRGSEDIVGLLSTPEPVVRLDAAVGDGSLVYNVVFYVGEFTDQGFIFSQLKKRILKRLTEEKIPFPRKEVHVFTSAEV